MAGKKVVIIGGVAAGASAAARLRRLDEHAEIIIFEKGEYISFANCGLPYYVEGVIPQRSNLLLLSPQDMQKRFNIQVCTSNEVTRIHPQERIVTVRNLISGETYRENYDYLILAPGSIPFAPPLEGLDRPNIFTVRNIPDSDIIRAYVQDHHPSRAVVVGGGFIGLEMADMLNHLGLDVTIVEASSQVMPPLDPEMAAFLHRYIIDTDIDLLLNRRVVGLKGKDKVEEVVLDDNSIVAADLVILGVGVKPETTLAREAGPAIGSTGGILVNEYLQTSDPFIYAGGDAIEIKNFQTGQEMLLPLAGPANRQGWVIANNICGRKIPYKGAQGTAIVKFGRMAAGVTGLNEKRLRALEQPYLAVHTYPSSHAAYYPGAMPMAIKLLFAPGDGKLLGAQIVGYEGVDKRIDVIATALRAGMTVFDLQELELAYAPPFSSAKDPVNMTGYAAGNLVNGDVEVIHWPEVPARVSEGAFLLDVRTFREASRGKVPGSYHIPLDEIRLRREEIPADKEILIYCHSGLRSYVASRILKQLGYRAVNISGGYVFWEVQQWDKANLQ